jgi:hypothetical protein
VLAAQLKEYTGFSPDSISITERSSVLIPDFHSTAIIQTLSTEVAVEPV